MGQWGVGRRFGFGASFVGEKDRSSRRGLNRAFDSADVWGKWMVDMADVTKPTEAGILMRWTWLRAVEWTCLPGFLSQIYVPVLLLILPFWKIAAFVVGANVLWSFVRYRFVSVKVAIWASNAVTLMKWPIAVGMAGYFLLAGGRAGSVWLCLLHAIFPVPGGICPGEIGRIQRMFLAKSSPRFDVAAGMKHIRSEIAAKLASILSAPPKRRRAG